MPSDVVGGVVEALREYRGSVRPSYDEVLHDVTAAAQASGSLGKVEIGALVVWKRLNASTRWAGELMGTPDVEVRAATAAARKVGLETSELEEAARTARSELSVLPGFRTGDAVASAVLCALVPQRFAVYDRRAHAGLRRLGIELSNGSGRYARYMVALDRVRQQALEEGVELSVRDVDLALFWIGG